MHVCSVDVNGNVTFPFKLAFQTCVLETPQQSLLLQL